MEGPSGATAASETPLGSEEEGVVELGGITKCSYSTEHSAWVPLSSFNINNLSPPFRNERVRAVIELKSQFTVRIVCNYTSTIERPEHFRCNSEGGRYGSGTLFFNGDVGEMNCPIQNCEHSKNPHKVFGYFKILTGPHIIFDDKEAIESEVDFFFDNQKRTCVLTAQGIKIRNSDIYHAPFCILDCISHDKALFDRSNENHSQLESLLREMKQEPRVADASDDKLLVFIAHPHGLAKHVAFGKVMKKEVKGHEVEIFPSFKKNVCCTLRYALPGCVGSGGGSLTEIESDGSCTTFALHMGKHSDGNRISGLGWTCS